MRLRNCRPLDVQPLGERAVGVLTSGVQLEDAQHERHLLRIWDWDRVCSLGESQGRLPVTSPWRAFSPSPILIQTDSETE